VGQPGVLAWFDNISSAGKMPTGPIAKIIAKMAVLLRRDALGKNAPVSSQNPMLLSTRLMAR
jgi:hypothetical protein